MKTVVYIIVLCLSFIGQAKAQRYLPGQRGIQITGGLSDNFRFQKENGSGQPHQNLSNKNKRITFVS